MMNNLTLHSRHKWRCSTHFILLVNVQPTNPTSYELHGPRSGTCHNTPWTSISLSRHSTVTLLLKEWQQPFTASTHYVKSNLCSDSKRQNIRTWDDVCHWSWSTHTHTHTHTQTQTCWTSTSVVTNIEQEMNTVRPSVVVNYSYNYNYNAGI